MLVDETARGSEPDLSSEPGELVMDLSADNVSFSTLFLLVLLTVDCLQITQNQSYLEVNTPVRGCFVGLKRLATLTPRSPSSSPPPVVVKKPLKFAPPSSDEDEDPEDISSEEDSVGDPTVRGELLSDSGEEELLAPRLPVPLKVLEYWRPALLLLGCLFTFLLFQKLRSTRLASKPAPAGPPHPDLGAGAPPAQVLELRAQHVCSSGY